MAKATILFPIFHSGQDITSGLNSALLQNEPDIEILALLQFPEDDVSEEQGTLLKSDARIRVIEGVYKNVAQMMNRGFAEATSEVLVYLPPNIVLDEGFVKKALVTFNGDEKVGIAYCDFREDLPDGHVVEKRLRDNHGDITERANFGYVKVYSAEAVRQVGGYDESFNRAEEYDLRLKIAEHFELAHIPEPLYSVRVSPDKAEERRASVGASKLFFPGEGKYGGFSYLFYDKDEEREIEEAFYAFLRREGAFLEHENTEVVYPTDQTFSPMVSVVVPVFNRVKFIGRAIESVLANEFRDFELIVVDNGSTDGTIEEVERYAERLAPQVRLIKNNRNIIAYSLNLGVNAAKGKYIAQLDSDDEYTPKTLGKMVAHLESHPKCALAISYYELIDEAGQLLKEFGIIKHLEYNRNNILRVDGGGALRMWHRKVIQEFGGFDENNFGHYGEDYDMVLKVSEKYDVDRVHEVLYRYRRHPDNTDVKREPEMKIANKTHARQLALDRRREINRRVAAGMMLWQ